MTAVPAGPASAAQRRPYVSGNTTTPVYSYANAIRESIWVDTSLDNDGDGSPDRVAIDIVRPSEAAQAGLKVPVIMEASPYYSCCGRGNETQVKDYDSNGVIDSMPLYYDNYFVPRGYAFVGVDLAGTNRSTGCEDLGGPEEVASAKAVIDWLNGRTTAHYANGTAAVADWTTGKVGMIGKSWDGTIANAVAATGVAGLTTIVPISAISSWYDYMRVNGVPRSTGWPGGLASEVGRTGSVCSSEYTSLTTGGDDHTGNYNAFWTQRNYFANVGNVKASVFAVHGLNDENVFPQNFAQWWSGLAAHDVPRKLWLSQEGHADPFDIRRSTWVTTLQSWFDYWLQGLDNGVMSQPTVDVERTPNQWQTQSDYPAAGSAPVTLTMGASSTGAGTLGTSPGGTATTRSITDSTSLTEANAVSSPTTTRTGRLAFLSAPLAANTQLSGTPTITLRVKATKPDTELSARLVDYGTATRDRDLADDESGVKTLRTRSCYGDSTTADSACYLDTAEDTASSSYGVLTRGWQDAAHYQSLSQQTPLTPGQWYTITWHLQPQDQILVAGHTLGLILSLSDTEKTSPSSTGATVTVDLTGSSLSLPLVGTTVLQRPTTTPHLTAVAPRTYPTRTRPLPS
ncbi:Xaa-Pro dipeptidyl-peptidase [Fodinicola feengrottensis]|uniref:Xaa-Pro dipeptidyl-peptidase n=1 Tax=Fodinicola feengrottensis TaxID=435914 RepID=A0ABN2HKQ5_9ACTN